ncbi:MAG: hypothetical protein J6J42_07760, partial [Lachnospiraceae bacterium]|nr:hypothetical protein [Lachnospiraceae bacterium]
DILRSRQRHPVVSMENIKEFLELSENSGGTGIPVFTDGISETGILDALMTLPEKFRLVLYLYYVEEYSINDIAGMIKRTPSAVKMRLKKGRQLLEEKYRKEYM